MIIILESIPLGLYVSKTIEKNYIYEIYSTSVVVADDVIIDDSNTVSQFGDAITLTKGMRGRVSDKIDYYSDQNGYENITADFQFDDARIVRVLIAVDKSNEELLYPTIDADKIESSHKIIAEYKQSRDSSIHVLKARKYSA